MTKNLAGDGHLPKADWHPRAAPAIILLPYCEISMGGPEDEWTGGQEMPGLTSGIPRALWALCGCFCDARYTETPPQASKQAVKKHDFVYLVWEMWWRESSGTGRNFQHALQAPLPVCCIYSFQCLPPCTNKYFHAVTATKRLSMWRENTTSFRRCIICLGTEEQ